MKTLAVLILLAGSVAAAGALAQPASTPAAKPIMRSMSPKTSADVAVLLPPRADDVWVNTGSGVYHCPADRWYGRTPKGAYMSEADAKTKGYRPEAAKACS
ncbi:MAG: hypothetical protein M3Y55_11800 [Pseudomonadota bacterium]|nr:hypothetical protein [Pseudomonadota bacterium]